jgi:hypothetical protein
MGRLCFGRYATLLKTATNQTQEYTVNMLFDAVVSPLSIKNKAGEPFYIEKGEASRLLNCKMGIPVEIQRGANSVAVTDSIVEYFSDTVIPSISKSKSKLLQDVAQLVKADAAITDSDKADLLSREKENTLAEFLANVFLYVIQQENDSSKLTALIAANKSYQMEISDTLVPDISAFDLRLFAETNGHCPNDNCGEPLFITKSGKTINRYKITRICADIPESFENSIALCPKCHDLYTVSPTAAEVERMACIKATLMRDSAALELAIEIKIEEGIGEILNMIANVSDGELVPLNYHPVKVEQKITKENGILLRKTLFNVTTYFNYVKEMFQQLGKEGRLRFDTVATQVNLCYKKERDNGLSQKEIYNALVEWLKTMTNGNREACEVVIAYFIQNCEVFDEIAK